MRFNLAQQGANCYRGRLLTGPICYIEPARRKKVFKVSEERFVELKEKLERLERIMPLERGKFLNSVYSHCFPMNPPATPEQVAAFEQEHNCSLPDDYREFIQRVGDGGPGEHGINALCPGCNWTGRPYKVVNLAPFPFVWQPSVDEVTGEELWPSFVFWEDIKEDVKNEGKNFDLALNFFSEGCYSELYLVLTGEEKGTVWRAYTESEGHFVPLQVRGQNRTSFIDWFEDWLGKISRSTQEALERDVPISPHS